MFWPVVYLVVEMPVCLPLILMNALMKRAISYQVSVMLAIESLVLCNLNTADISAGWCIICAGRQFFI